jgi:hypothetical protein
MNVRETVVIRREKLFDKVCPVCDQAFQAVNRCRYCSRSCRYKANYLVHAEERRAKRRTHYRQVEAQARKRANTKGALNQGVHHETT